MHICSRLGKVDMVQQLLQCGACANAATTSGYTPLHLAAREGHHDVAVMLLDNGASLSSATKASWLLASPDAHSAFSTIPGANHPSQDVLLV